jgi:hypothetical protein
MSIVRLFKKSCRFFIRLIKLAIMQLIVKSDLKKSELFILVKLLLGGFSRSNLIKNNINHYKLN